MRPTPPELGLPEKFAQWRPLQYEAIDHGTLTNKRFTAHSIPTGGGKSLIYIAQAHLTGARSAFITSTKGLQDQIMHDFGGSLPIASIKGRSNYRCAHRPGWNCEQGHVGGCRNKGSVNCPSTKAYIKALSSKYVVTNYSYWIAVHKYGMGLGGFNHVFFDEAHSAYDELSNAVQIRISSHEIEEMLGLKFPKSEDLYAWKLWASPTRKKADSESRILYSKILTSRDPKQAWINEYNHLRNLVRKLGTLAIINPKIWVLDEWEYGYQFDCIRPSAYAESLLYLKIPRVSFFSATIRPKTLSLIGVHDDYEFWDYESSFEPAGNRVVHVPTARVDAKMDAASERIWLMRADQIIQRRLDRRGTFHTVSYARRDKVVDYSEHASIILSNFKGDITSEVVERFKRTPAPAVLVSPSITTGYDFPYDDCRYQIIGKIPWPDSRSKIVRARQDLDPMYGPYTAMQNLVQTAGRARRAGDDWAENIVIDDHIQWFMDKYYDFAPKAFNDSYVGTVSVIPPPPPL